VGSSWKLCDVEDDFNNVAGAHRERLEAWSGESWYEDFEVVDADWNRGDDDATSG
jgi:hypothetical protein